MGSVKSSSKNPKGSLGYIKAMRGRMLIHTLVLFAIAFAIFFIGKFKYSAYSTMFSITAIVVCIPASMRCVSFIMFMIHKVADRDFCDECMENASSDELFFESVITTSEKSYDVYAFGIFPDSLIGYCPDTKKDISKLEKHLREMFTRNDLASVGIKIFSDRAKFLSRLQQLSGQDNKDPEKTGSIRRLISNLSL